MTRLSRRPMASVAFALTALAVLLGACAAGTQDQVEGASIADGSEPAAREFDRQLRWESALLEDLGHSLTIVFTGGREGNLEDNPCVGEYDVDVQESDDSVVVTLYSLRLVKPPELPEEFGGDGFPPLMYLVAPTDNGLFNMDGGNLEQDLTTVSEIGVRGNESGAFVITSLVDGSRTFVFEHGGRHHRVTLQADIDDDVALRFIDGLS